MTMGVCESAASKEGEEDAEIDRSLLKSFLLLQTVLPAVCNMGERMLPTVRALSDAAKGKWREEGVEPNDP